MSVRRLIAIALLGMFLGSLSRAGWAADEFTYEKIADDNTKVPDQNKEFQFFGPTPAFDGDNVAFIATVDQSPSPTTGSNSLYGWIGGSLVKIANFTTAVPSVSGSVFSSFTDCSIEDGKVAFKALYKQDINLNQGIYVSNGSIQKIGDRTEYYSVSGPTISQGTIVYAGYETTNPFHTGIYSGPGSMLIDDTTLIPGSMFHFVDFEKPAISGSNIAFYGGKDATFALPNGIYVLGSGGGLTTVATSGGTIPGGAGMFASLNRAPSMSGTDVAFIGYGDTGGYSGVFARIGGTLQKIADTSTPIPGGTGNFTSFVNNLAEGVSIDGGKVLFTGSGSSFQSGLYLWDGTALVKVLDNGDVLDGSVITDAVSSPSFSIGINCLRGDQFAFTVKFAAGQPNAYAIYLATIGGGSSSGCTAEKVASQLKRFVPKLPFRLSKFDQTAKPLLADLRRFRDDVLQPTTAGQRLATLYYRHSDAIFDALREHPPLMVDAAALMLDLQTDLRRQPARPEAIVIARETWQRGLTWLDHLEPVVAEEARDGIREVREILTAAAQRSGEKSLHIDLTTQRE